MSLVETRKDGIITVNCKHCGTMLAEIQEDSTKTSECQHFTWEEVTELCFDRYWYSNECDAGYIERLRRTYYMRIDDGERYFLLVPREAEEQ